MFASVRFTSVSHDWNQLFFQRLSTPTVRNNELVEIWRQRKRHLTPVIIMDIEYPDTTPKLLFSVLFTSSPTELVSFGSYFPSTPMMILSQPLSCSRCQKGPILHLIISDYDIYKRIEERTCICRHQTVSVKVLGQKKNLSPSFFLGSGLRYPSGLRGS